MKVCIISEGSYPVVQGGLSEWAHELIKELNYVNFDVFCIAPPGRKKPLYAKLPNVDRISICEISQSDKSEKSPDLPKSISGELANYLKAVLYGEPLNCENLSDLLKEYRITKNWLRSKDFWYSTVQFYRDECPDRDFSDFFWTTQGIYSMLINALTLAEQLPKADVYHSLTSGLGGLLGSIAKIRNGSHLVVAELGQYLRERAIDLSRYKVREAEAQQIMKFSKTMLKTSFEYADLIVPVSKSYIAPELELGASPDKIRIVTNGINSDKFTPPSLSKNGAAPVVGCFARVVPIKGQETFIKACKKVIERHEATFVIVGEVQDDEYYRQCQGLVHELGLAKNIRFVGYAKDLLEWYHKVDVFVLPSLWEGIPLALLEAMSCGLPCVASEVGGVPDILSGTNAGYVVPPSEPDVLASRICELLENEKLRTAMGTRARELVKSKYTLRETAHKILGVYLEVLLNGSAVR